MTRLRPTSMLRQGGTFGSSQRQLDRARGVGRQGGLGHGVDKLQRLHKRHGLLSPLLELRAVCIGSEVGVVVGIGILRVLLNIAHGTIDECCHLLTCHGSRHIGSAIGDVGKEVQLAFIGVLLGHLLDKPQGYRCHLLACGGNGVVVAQELLVNEVVAEGTVDLVLCPYALLHGAADGQREHIGLRGSSQFGIVFAHIQLGLHVLTEQGQRAPKACCTPMLLGKMALLIVGRHAAPYTAFPVDMLASGIGAHIGLVGGKVGLEVMDARNVSLFVFWLKELEGVIGISLALAADAAGIIHLRGLRTGVILHATVGGE